MFGLLGLLGTLAVGAAWKAHDNAEINRLSREYHQKYDNTNQDRQWDLYVIFLSGRDVDGSMLPFKPRNTPEINRLVKIQIEKEGYRYIDNCVGGLKHAVFDEQGRLIRHGDQEFNPETGYPVGDWREAYMKKR